MKTGTLTSMTSSLTIFSLSVLLVATFSAPVSAKRSCKAYGHSCYGGHGKRFAPNPQNDRFKSVEADPGNSNDVVREWGNGMTRQQVQDFVAYRNRALELSRRGRGERKYMPMLLKEWLTSYRLPYNADSERNEE